MSQYRHCDEINSLIECLLKITMINENYSGNDTENVIFSADRLLMLM